MIDEIRDHIILPYARLAPDGRLLDDLTHRVALIEVYELDQVLHVFAIEDYILNWLIDDE